MSAFFLYSFKLISGESVICQVIDRSPLEKFPPDSNKACVVMVNPTKVMAYGDKAMLVPFLDGLVVDKPNGGGKEIAQCEVTVPMNRVVTFTEVMDISLVKEYRRLFMSRNAVE